MRQTSLRSCSAQLPNSRGASLAVGARYRGNDSGDNDDNDEQDQERRRSRGRNSRQRRQREPQRHPSGLSLVLLATLC